jgi:hypothetical protein
MPVIPPAESGSALDRRIARLIDGSRNGGEPPHYSTEESPASDLVQRLEDRGIAASMEQDDGLWYCVFWAPRPGDSTKERVASGSAAARPLAICRAVLNLPLVGSGKRLRLRRASRGWIPDEAGLHPAFTAAAEDGVPPSEGGTDSPVVDGDDRFLEPSRAAQEF